MADMNENKIVCRIRLGAKALSTELAIDEINRRLNDGKAARLTVTHVEAENCVSRMNVTHSGESLYVFEIEGTAADAETVRNNLRGSGLYLEIVDHTPDGAENKKDSLGLDGVVKASLENIDIEGIVRERLSKAISDAIDDACKFGKVRGAVREKVEGAILPALENTDFSDYVSNLDAALSDLARNPEVSANNRILENFRTLIGSREYPKDIGIDDLIEEYGSFVAEEIDEYDLETEENEYLEKSYMPVECHFDAELIESGNQGRIERYAVKLRADTANGDGRDTKYGTEMDVAFELRRWVNIDPADTYTIELMIPPSLESLKGLSTFECRLMALARERVKIKAPGGIRSEDFEIAPAATPEE